jgi:predicted ribosome quality control (RQC) complex YloA/Tae2 family protein
VHNNYYFLRHLSKELSQKLTGMTLAESFSQNKDELILGFSDAEKEFYIKAVLQPDFCCLSFPPKYDRAKKNSVALFTSLLDQRVTQIRQYKNERSFSIIFENNEQLLFKMHGNRSNIIHISNNQVLALFKNKLAKDKNIDANQLDRHLTQDKEAFMGAGGNLLKIFPTFGSEVKAYLEEKNIFNLPLSEQWAIVEEVRQNLLSPKSFYITSWHNKVTLSLIEMGDVVINRQSAIEALNEFFYTYSRQYFIENERNLILRQLEKLKKQSESYIHKTSEKLKEIETSTKNEEIANIIMANLHQIPAQKEEITLYNFYNDKDIVIKLKKDLSPQKNAEAYYRKAKNQKLETNQLEENILHKTKFLKSIEKHIEHIAQVETVKELRQYMKDNQLHTDTSQQENLPYKTFHCQGFDIWVGKNAQSNDILTQKHTYKEDLWLHAKDVSGSHVIIKYQAGKKFPNTVIEKAAQLAAWYSKRKNDTLCPVTVTPKKFVRKPKGAPPGAVIVEKENVILVPPAKD